ncbi:Single hybrid motif [Pseudocohnilembus persalinus]|uniref:Single hybrid motif n=1 Tax=Pseudocohnilembus persalinus TaxID=266149 RepID=A0A0V0R3U5_PSEPJ|nr:Single hybrid motif [Pseudocohnilembus persalinus]|eukprot:KRX09024.1 Single hybrid motif [Pseudocohnilembus persalinus]
MLKKILIANRGEIACRIIKTAKILGVETVAIYSDIDRNSKFVDLADSAYRVGPAPSLQSYLQGDKIIDIALNTNSQAIHPGFGFLSENADFADKVTTSGIKFIGPPSSAIRKMGSKSESKQIMIDAKVPVVQGYHGENQDPQFLQEKAREIEYPVLIKAVMGGGGKGMRIVFKDSDFQEALESAKSESRKSFGDDRVLVEKYITKPRHIEVQVFGDNYGNYAHLFERDCSIQRRHQKVVEEAPSGIDSKLRNEIGKSAVDAARAVGYQNAGTVEFIFDLETNKYYFMEMNTRLQVEHPITEMITGQDLVEWQLKIASGLKLPKSQDQLQINGHAIEARIYSEDPFNNFYPHNGTLSYYKEPQNARIDSGVRQGDEISIFYDPMISKLIVHGKDREEAVQKFKSALKNYKIFGLPNNLNFLKQVADNQEFQDFTYDTGFIAKYGDTLIKQQEKFDNNDILGAVIGKIVSNESQINLPSQLLNFRSGSNLEIVHRLNIHAKHVKEDQELFVKVINQTNGQRKVIISKSNKFEDSSIIGQFENVSYKQINENQVQINTASSVLQREFQVNDEQVSIFDANGDEIQVSFESNLTSVREEAKDNTDPLTIRTPMPSTVLKINVQVGDKVSEGQSIAVLEAMKMEHTIKARVNSVVKAIHYKQGEFVQPNSLLIELEAAE